MLFDHIDRKMHLRLMLLIVLSIIAVLLAIILPPVSQPQSYHQFVDQRSLFGIPNFMNVVSNLAIFLSGMAGLLLLYRSCKMSGKFVVQQAFITSVEYWPYLVFFISVVLVAPGSAYYHWEPDNDSLFWDRLPIGVGVTALLAIVLSERIHPRIGLWCLPLLVFMGASSVLYWYWSEQQSSGNLNFYILVQFYSLLLVVLISAFLPSRYTCGGDWYLVIGFYVLAKLAETLDQPIYCFGEIISGHTLKHLLAALAIVWIVRMLHRRRPVTG